MDVVVLTMYIRARWVIYTHLYPSIAPLAEIDPGIQGYTYPKPVDQWAPMPHIRICLDVGDKLALCERR